MFCVRCGTVVSVDGNRGPNGESLATLPLPLVGFGGSACVIVILCLGFFMSLYPQQRTVSRLA